MLLLNIHREMFDEYREVTKDTKYENGQLLNLNNIFPNNIPERYPKQKFAEEIKNMYQELRWIDEKATKLHSSLILYYKNEELITDYRNIVKEQGPIRVEFRKLINAEDEDEFNKRHDSFMVLIGRHKSLINKFKNKLITTEIQLENKRKWW